MASAREQAREAAKATYPHSSYPAVVYADKVSDVWEPIVRAALALAERSTHDGHWSPNGCTFCLDVAQIKESLDG